MDSLISRQAAIDALFINRDPLFHNSADFEGTLYDISNLPSAQPDVQRMQDLEQAEIQKAYELGKLDAMEEMLHWIPCSERLPERGKDVLVTRDYDGRKDNNKSCRYVEVASCYGEDDDITWNSFSDEYKMHPKNHHVIAWMPLPEPYQERQADKC